MLVCVRVDGGWNAVYSLMLCCVAFSVYCHTECAHKCKMKLSWVLKTALDLAAAALCIEWRVGLS